MSAETVVNEQETKDVWIESVPVAYSAPPNTELSVSISRSHNHDQGRLFLDEVIPISTEATNSDLIELRRRIFQVVTTWEKWREKE